MNTWNVQLNTCDAEQEEVSDEEQEPVLRSKKKNKVARFSDDEEEDAKLTMLRALVREKPDDGNRWGFRSTTENMLDGCVYCLREEDGRHAFDTENYVDSALSCLHEIAKVLHATAYACPKSLHTHTSVYT